MKKQEACEQEKLISWCWLRRGIYPELDLIYHVPNGGSRNRLEAVNLKKQGVKAGVPDLCLPVARGNYHGLYIEMKAGNNKPTKEQKQWLEALNRQGYKAVVCYGFEAATEAITKYLEGAE